MTFLIEESDVLTDEQLEILKKHSRRTPTTTITWFNTKPSSENIVDKLIEIGERKDD